MASIKVYINFKDTYRLKVKEWKNIPCNWKPKESEGSYTYLHKRDFKLKIVTKSKESYYIMIKKPIHQEDLTIINIYTTNIRVPKYIKQMLRNLKEEIQNDTIIIKKN